ncbi:MAG: dephospho-CoA kinase [Bacteroidales bacterium]|nr:dephospho-CoA kinase [Bacteroidales bacterium]
MLKVGLTGNIGSGKTFVSKVFSVLRVPVYVADEAGKKHLDDPLVKSDLVEHFSKTILTKDGKINRKSLASIVFNDPFALQVLNSIIHPLVIRDFEEWTLLHFSAVYVIHEAAIIFESGFQKKFDFIIHVSCPKEIAIERVMHRDHVDGNSVLKRMAFQMEDAEKSSLSDFIINNDGTNLVIPQVLSIHKQLIQIGAQRDKKSAFRSDDNNENHEPT